MCVSHVNGKSDRENASVAIDVANDVLPGWRIEVYPSCLANQNRCNMPILNDR